MTATPMGHFFSWALWPWLPRSSLELNLWSLFSHMRKLRNRTSKRDFHGAGVVDGGDGLQGAWRRWHLPSVAHELWRHGRCWLSAMARMRGRSGRGDTWGRRGLRACRAGHKNLLWRRWRCGQRWGGGQMGVTRGGEGEGAGADGSDEEVADTRD